MPAGPVPGASFHSPSSATMSTGPGRGPSGELMSDDYGWGGGDDSDHRGSGGSCGDPGAPTTMEAPMGTQDPEGTTSP